MDITKSLSYRIALNKLAKQNYSRHKLEKKLFERDCDADEIKIALDYLIEKQWFKEEDYTESRIKGHMRKGIHPKLILRKLSEEKVYTSLNNIHSIFEENDFTIEIQIKRLIERKYRAIEAWSNAESYKEKMKYAAKLQTYLQSKGHSPYIDLQNYI